MSEGGEKEFAEENEVKMQSETHVMVQHHLRVAKLMGASVLSHRVLKV